MKLFEDEIKASDGIGFIDLGSSGGIAGRWEPIENLISLIGFDPDSDECSRLSSLPSNLHSSIYLPYAISGNKEDATFYITSSPSCSSLIKPRKEWLDRFSFKDLFEIVDEKRIETKRLAEIKELEEKRIDVIKSDTQGMELPILVSAGRILDEAFEVETETGFTENYHGETTFSMIDEFMRKKNFLLFDMRVHRVQRDNLFSESKETRGQILWCEAVWLKDYVAMNSEERNRCKLDRAKAIRALTISGIQKAIDFGFELAKLFFEMRLLNKREFEELKKEEMWKINSKHRW